MPRKRRYFGLPDDRRPLLVQLHLPLTLLEMQKLDVLKVRWKVASRAEVVTERVRYAMKAIEQDDGVDARLLKAWPSDPRVVKPGD